MPRGSVVPKCASDCFDVEKKSVGKVGRCAVKHRGPSDERNGKEKGTHRVLIIRVGLYAK